MSGKEIRGSAESSGTPHARPNRPPKTKTEMSLPKASTTTVPKMANLHAQLTDTTDIARQNIESAMERGEALSSLQNKASDLETKAAVFSGGVEKVKKKIWWKEKKAIAVVFGITLLVLGAVVAVVVISTLRTGSRM